MERAALLTGVGGQSVQLAAQVLARAALGEGREVLLLGTYGGTMRGGSTASTLVIADAPITSPPIVAGAWSALAMHHAFWEPVRRRLRPGAVVVVNEPLFQGALDREAQRVFGMAATELAAEIGAPLAASLVLLGAYAAITGIVGLDSLVAGMREAVPVYRRQHLEANERALRAGFERAPAGAAPAWREEAAT